MTRRGKGRGRLSSIDKLPEECDEIILWAAKELSERERTQQDIYSEFYSKCDALKAEYHGELEFKIPAKSSFNRYAMKQAILRRRMDDTRRISKAIAGSFDGKSSDNLTIVTAEAIKTLVFEVLTAKGEAGLDPKGALALAGALYKATQAQHISTARRLKVEKDFGKQVDNTLDTLEKEAGLTAERAADLRRKLLGVRIK